MQSLFGPSYEPISILLVLSHVSTVCVIDCGRVREVRQNKRTSTSTLVTDWCSKASSKQRAGRAGRVQPGICLNLYSSATFKSVMKASSEPELKRVPLEEVCLSILASGFSNSCMHFLSQAPEPPSEKSVQNALKALLEVGAISVQSLGRNERSTETLTPLGVHLSKLPVDVRLGKMMIFGALFGCIDKVVTIAAGLSCQSPFSTFVTDAHIAKAKQSTFHDESSDFITICNVWREFRKTKTNNEGRKFCNTNYLKHTVLREMRDARWQFLDLLSNIGFLDRDSLTENGARKKWDDNLIAASRFNRNGENLDVVHAVVCAGLYPNVARIDVAPGSLDHSIWHKQERLHFHSTSVNSKKKRFLTTERWIAFHEKFGTSNRVSVASTCFVHPFALLIFGGDIQVKHLDRKVLVDEWIEIGMSAQTGVLLRELRNQVEGLLQEMVLGNPNGRSGETKHEAMVEGIIKLITN